jgi:LysR family transcriptional regulator, hydrogen peroxide-inducible genes activator
MFMMKDELKLPKVGPLRTNGLDFRQLRAFHAVASARAFGRASKVLGVGQPAISKAISAMERELGVLLFERHATGVVLTEVGEQIFSVSSSVFEQMEQIREIVDVGRGALKGELAITSNEHIASYLLPGAIMTCVPTIRCWCHAFLRVPRNF